MFVKYATSRITFPIETCYIETFHVGEKAELLLTGSKMTGFNQMISLPIFAEFPHVVPMETPRNIRFSAVFRGYKI